MTGARQACPALALLLAALAPAAALAQFGIVDLGPNAEVLAPEVIQGAVDPRFFGTYCEQQPFRLCKTVRVKILFIPAGTREVCAEVRDARVHLDHRLAGGLVAQGHVAGGGTLRVDGEEIGLSVAGPVLRTGLARLAGVVPGIGHTVSNATLSADGLEIEVFAHNERVTLRKDACGNTPPRVELVAPRDGDTFSFGETVTLRGEVTDAEDASFPAHRMHFESHRDGVLEGAGSSAPTSLVVHTAQLSPGQHAISFIATDSGGLTDSRTVTVEVENLPPEPPVILAPAAGDRLIAGSEVLLQGTGYDAEEFRRTGAMLDGAALTWSAGAGDGPLETIGSGRRLEHVFTEAGEVTIRLTARDTVGATASSRPRTLTVLPAGENGPPRVAITVPDPTQVSGPIAQVLAPPFGLSAVEAVFAATAEDSEDPFPELALEWRATVVEGAGAAPSPVTGSTSATLTLDAATTYDLTFSATDSGGLTASQTVRVVVIAAPVL